VSPKENIFVYTFILVFYGIVNVRYKFTKHQLVGKIFPWVALVETAVGLSFNCLSFRGDRQLQSQGRRQLGRSKENLERQYLKGVEKQLLYIWSNHSQIYIY